MPAGYDLLSHKHRVWDECSSVVTSYVMGTKSKTSYLVQLGARGRVVLPAEIRERFHLDEGDRLLFTVEGPGILRLTTAREVAKRGRGALRELIGDHDVVGELLAERRREAERE